MAKLGDFRVEFVGVDKLSPIASKARRSTDDLNRSTKGLSKSMVGFNNTMRSLLPMLTGAGIIAGLTKMIKTTADAGDKFAKMSQKVGLSVETLSTFDHVAKISGITLDTVAVGLRRFAQNALDMSRGIGEAKREFEDLGISVTDSSGNVRAMESLLLDVAEKFSKMEDGTVKTAMAMRLFGRSGTEMIPMLNAGREGLAALMEEARKLGLVFDKETAQAMERFNDNMTRLKGQLEGISRYMAGPFITTLSGVLEKLGFAGAQSEMQMFESAISRLKIEIASLAKVVEGGDWYGKLNRAFMWKKDEEAAKQKLAELRAELKMYEQHLTALKEQQKKTGDSMKSDFNPALDEHKKKIQEISHEISELQLLREAGMTGADLERIKEENAALEEQARILKEMVEAEQKRIDTKWEGFVDPELPDIVGAVNSELKAMDNLSHIVAGTIGGGISNAFSQAMYGAREFEQSVKNMFQNLIQEAMQYIVKLLIIKTLQPESEGGGGLGDIGSAIVGAIGTIVGAAFGGIGTVVGGLLGGITGSLGLFHQGGVIPSAHQGLFLAHDERLIKALSGEAVLSRRGVAAIGGPAGVAAINRGEVTMNMTNYFGNIQNISNVEDIATILGRRIATAFREM